MEVIEQKVTRQVQLTIPFWVNSKEEEEVAAILVKFIFDCFLYVGLPTV